MDYGTRAKENFLNGYNCCQAVFLACTDELGLDTETRAKIASSFGGGMGGMRQVCGAVSGMVLVLGDLCGYQDPTDAAGKQALYALVQQMCGSFEASEGSLICRDLLGLAKGEDLAEPAVRTEEYYQSRPCVGACRRAAEILEAEMESLTAEILG